MIVAVCKETGALEKRVALNPESAGKLVSKGVEVWIEKGAGTNSSLGDGLYEAQGCKITSDRKKLFAECDLMLAVNAPPDDDLKSMKAGAALTCFLWPLQNPDLVELLRKQKVTAIAMDAIPRISRAQTMDALSSMSNIAGYKAVLIAANELDRYMPMMMTAAGTIPPAKTMVLGAGVAGLQAIATARRLGAVVEAYDVRPVVKEQVESLGAKFIDIPIEEGDTETKGGYAKEVSEEVKARQMEVLHTHVAKSDIVITTALVPGKKAPMLISTKMVEDMTAGSVLVDLAAEQGGNCELTKAGETVLHKGVKIIGPVNLPSTLANHASRLYSRNMMALMELYLKDGAFKTDFNDQIVRESTITHDGEVVSPLLKKKEQ